MGTTTSFIFVELCCAVVRWFNHTFWTTQKSRRTSLPGLAGLACLQPLLLLGNVQDQSGSWDHHGSSQHQICPDIMIYQYIYIYISYIYIYMDDIYIYHIYISYIYIYHIYIYHPYIYMIYIYIIYMSQWSGTIPIRYVTIPIIPPDNRPDGSGAQVLTASGPIGLTSRSVPRAVKAQRCSKTFK